MILKRACRRLAAGSLLLLLSATLLHAVPPPQSGTVSWIYDGDTLEIPPHGKVRLIGIDAPEHQDSARDNFYRRWDIPPERLRRVAAESREWLIREVKNQQVRLSFDQTLRDPYGRLLAYVHLPDGRLLNALLVEKGYASVFRKYDFRLKQSFLQLEETARKDRVGLWSPLAR